MDSLLLHAQDLAKQSCAPFLSIPKRIAYVVSHGQSYASNGYAVRTQGIAQALNEHGFETLCFVRPGRPWSVDKTRSIQIAAEVKVKGVRYIHTRQTADSRDEIAELENDVQRYIELFKVYRPEVVIAASNYKVGLPAWVAAQRLGLPFYNEVRGFWELSKDAREPGYANTAAFKKEQERDTFVAQQAVHVFTLNQPMKDELVRRGVETSKIQLVPNGVSELPEIKPADPELKRKLGINAGEKVIGYVGSFNAYEGLDTLIAACEALATQGEPIKLLLVGSDQPLPLKSKKSKDVNENERQWLIEVGRVPHYQVKDYYSLIDVIVIPRKKLAVCEIVPPIKIVEALSYNKRVVVSDVSPLLEYINQYDGIVSFQANNSFSLQKSIYKLLLNEKSSFSPQILFFKQIEKFAKTLKFKENILEKSIVDIGLQKIEIKEDQYLNKSLNEVVRLIKEGFLGLANQADELTRLSKLLMGKNNNQAIYLGELACQKDPKDYRKKWFGFMLFNSGSIIKSYEVLSSISSKYKFREVEKNKLLYINGCRRLLHSPPVIKSHSDSLKYDLNPNRVLYVASSSRPYHYNGYTSRTHGIVKGIIKHGWDVLCVTRPGYPEDRVDRNLEETVDYAVRELDGVKYQALEGPHRRNTPLDEYIYRSAELIAAKAKDYKASIIHAASNYEAALPAILAAKKLGIKFVYEVRGLWEYTAASRQKEWEATERFDLDVMLESITAKNADAVATLTVALAKELVGRGVNDKNIIIVPNAIDPTEFKPRKRNVDLAKKHGVFENDFIVGYAGSIVGYEGLDDLILAFSQLYTECENMKLLIIGDGNALDNLKSLALELDVNDRVIFTGRVSAELVPDYLSLVSVISLPRKPYKVCHLVSPLKPFEAMAMKIPLIVSDVDALNEIALNGTLALVHKSGDFFDLSRKLKACFKDKESLRSRVKFAEKHAINKHNWNNVSREIVERYKYL